MNKSEEFDKAIAEIVLALEKAGVMDEQLRRCIDQLFILKELVLIRDISSSPTQGFCYRCRFFSDLHCNKLKIDVMRFFGCRFYEFPDPTSRKP